METRRRPQEERGWSLYTFRGGRILPCGRCIVAVVNNRNRRDSRRTTEGSIVRRGLRGAGVDGRVADLRWDREIVVVVLWRGCRYAVARQGVKAVKGHNAGASPTEWERGEGENGLHNRKLE